MPETYLVTGAAGFIGHALAKRLLSAGHRVIGLDNLNAYYAVSLKQARLAELTAQSNFTWIHADIKNSEALMEAFKNHRPNAVVHLAAQAGVRYSIDHPQLYVDSNIVGFLNVLEACRRHPVNHLVYASSSSVYGANRTMPFATSTPADHPVSLYGATKKAGEAIAHSYSTLYNIPMTGLRFFTVYGPWGRPDMAYFKFACAMSRGEAIDVYNRGDMQRDFTYVDDIIEAITRLIPRIPTAATTPDLDHSASGPHRLYNIGHHTPEPLMKLIRVLEENLGYKAKTNLLPMQAGDVPATWADVEPLKKDIGFAPATSIEEGIRRFAEWFKAHPQFHTLA